MKAFIFDLDDTLYPEIDFAKSGFRRVARYAKERYGYDDVILYDRFLELLQTIGRGQVFDKVISETGLVKKEIVYTFLHVYRTHIPNIDLYSDVPTTLMKMKSNGYRLGLITDGASVVQANKIEALGIKMYFDRIICTDDLGRDQWKPSPVPFLVMCEYLGVQPGEATYIGNDVAKDFYAPNILGMSTIQIVRSGELNTKDVALPEAFRARRIIKNLHEILE